MSDVEVLGAERYHEADSEVRGGEGSARDGFGAHAHLDQELVGSSFANSYGLVRGDACGISPLCLRVPSYVASGVVGEGALAAEVVQEEATMPSKVGIGDAERDHDEGGVESPLSNPNGLDRGDALCTSPSRPRVASGESKCVPLPRLRRGAREGGTRSRGSK